MMYLLLYFLLYPVYFGVVTSHIIFICKKVQFVTCSNIFSTMKLVNTSLHTQLKQTNLENQLHISIKSPKECFNMVFHHFMDELKQCNSDMQMDLKLPVPVFLCLYIKYLVVMLPFRMISFHNVFCFISFPREFAMFQSVVTRFIGNY